MKELVINKYEKKKRQYEMFKRRNKRLFQEKLRGLKKLNFYKKRINNGKG